VSLGEADAGIVYTSDVAGEAASTTGRIDIPDELNTIASYPIAPIKDAPNAELAQRFVAYILSPEVQTVLVNYGFIPTTGSASGGVPAGGPIQIRGLVAKPVTLSVDDLRGRRERRVPRRRQRAQYPAIAATEILGQRADHHRSQITRYR